MRLCICYNEQTNVNANEARLGWCETTVKFRETSSSSVVGGETEHDEGGGAENDRQERGSLPFAGVQGRRLAHN
jgi:hypothetical protein